MVNQRVRLVDADARLAWRVRTTTLLIAPEILSVMSRWIMKEPIVPAPTTAKFLYPDMF